MTEPIQHVVMLWLKDPSDPVALRDLKSSAHSLLEIPGVEDVKIGPSIGEPVGTELDVAMTVTFADLSALDVYHPHPLHLRMVRTVQHHARDVKVFYFSV